MPLNYKVTCRRVDEATPGEIARKAGVPRPTVNQAINKLLKLKKVERRGLARAKRPLINPEREATLVPMSPVTTYAQEVNALDI